MDTKLKSISSKSIAFILVIVLIVAAVMQLVYTHYANLNLESIAIREYKDSRTYANKVNDAINYTYGFIEPSDKIRFQAIDFLYYIKKNSETYSNAPIHYRRFLEIHANAFYSYENGIYTVGKTTNPSLVRSFPGDGDYTMYIAFSDAFLEEQQDLWDEGREKLIPIAFSVILCLFIALLGIIYLIIITIRKIDTEQSYRSWSDNLYTELLFLGFIPLLTWISSLRKIIEYDIFTGYRQVFSFLLIGFTTLLATILSVVVLLSLVRKIKMGRFLNKSIMRTIFEKTNYFIKDLFDGSRFDDYQLTKTLHNRQVIFIVTSAVLVLVTLILTVNPIFMIIPLTLQVLVIYWYIRCNKYSFDEINKGFNESYEEQMKSERMKINLITNVSHDLKTPLTSIISYVDLLSREKELSETAKDYIKILTEKSSRLNNIVGDLFDLAKSTSGNINLDFEMLDLKKLIEQTLGDMEDNIEKSGFQIKTNLPEGPVNIFSDGKRLYRIFQNIIDNALKYSLEGTRIFIELEESNEKAFVTVKNTASYEMNFTAQEVLQRFNRGDQARSTEGSGLGLSIAESFTNVCGGDLKVDIDGDMFKVIISFKIEVI